MIKILVIFIIFYNNINGMRRLILIRHGESLWNKEKRYTGWANIPLTNKGKKEAEIAGEQLSKYNVLPTISFTSTLNRSIDTNNIMLEKMKLYIPNQTDWRLNERHYGKLSGYHRNDIEWVGKYFDLPPNDIDPIEETSMVKEETYSPEYGESYYMTYLRVLPFFNNIKELIEKGEVPILCSHRNTLRVIIKKLENYSHEDIQNIDVPNATPIVYEFDNNMNILKKYTLDKSL